MRTLTLITFLFFCSFTVTKADDQETHKTAAFIKVWGFLKYYHPTVAKGELDWDESFRKGLNRIKSIQSKKELNAFYTEWIDGLGKVEECRSCKTEMSSLSKYNLDMSWLRNSAQFEPSLIEKLVYIQHNRNQKTNHYISASKGTGNAVFTNEKVYTDSIYPSAQLRLLSLARYWNMIQYFFPYRYQTDQHWDAVLVEMVPKFKNAPDVTAYHLAMAQLVEKINDSHAKFGTAATERHFGVKWVPFRTKVIADKAIVTGFYNDSLAKIHDIRLGDVFLKIDGRTIAEVFREKSPYIGASNESVKRRDIPFVLFNGSTDKIETEFERDGVVAKKTIPRTNFKDLKYVWGQPVQTDTIKILEGNIGYVNMGVLLPKQVPKVAARLKDTKAIIFDVRNYPKGTMYALANFLSDKSTPFVRITAPDMRYPGSFYYSTVLNAGKNNKDNYKGQVILLCNETTQSHAEFTLMALQTVPNVTTVGSQTSGADGNVSLITLPGGFKTYMTGLGIYYPDGRETQRIGIVPDVVVQPTIGGIRAGKDEVMEKALELIRK